MRSVSVALGERSYRIHIGAGLLARADLLAARMRAPRAMVISNSVVAPLHLPALARSLRAAGIRVDELVLPDGEQFKEWRTLNSIYDALIEGKAERSTTLVALGGGVTGDLVGFAAATYQRGVPFVQVPTTLLAQVDSSVGGKTAINHPLGKNMIGAFHQPRLVLADTDTLRTLPDRELRAGLAEVIKYGLIRDLPFLEWIESNLDRLLAREADALAYAIERSCRNKAEVVQADETESGVRAILNLGHTFGHAIESGLGYGEWLHGEAVAAGTMMAAELSRRLGRLSPGDVDRIEALLARAGLPVRGPSLGVERYLEAMSHDKKVEDGRLRLVLLDRLGCARVCADAPPAELAASIGARSGDG